MFKVYRKDLQGKHELVGSLKYGEDAACLATSMGDDCVIKFNNRIVFRTNEWNEDDEGAVSFDAITHVMHRRIAAFLPQQKGLQS